MRRSLAFLLPLCLGTTAALALPPQRHSYADAAVRYNQARLAKGYVIGFERSGRWPNNWNSHYRWCINLSPDKISEAQAEARARLYVLRTMCPSALLDCSSDGATAPRLRPKRTDRSG
jgi:hypothetical protein